MANQQPSPNRETLASVTTSLPNELANPSCRQSGQRLDESNPRSDPLRVCGVVALLGLGVLLLGWPSPAVPIEQPVSADSKEKPEASHFRDQVRPFLARHCLECHGEKKPKGDFRVDQLSQDLGEEVSRQRWLTVLQRLRAGEMPPKTKPRPPEQEVRALANWIDATLESTSVRRAEGRTVLRRLNRVEYENTVRDLLGVEVHLKEQFPQDGQANGFDNVGAALHTSSFLMERYLAAADTALDQAIANRPRPPSIEKRYTLKDQHQVKVTTERVFRRLDDTVVCFCSSLWQTVGLTQFYPRDGGLYRFRISASGFQSDGKPVTYRVTVGRQRLAGKSGLVGYFDAPADKQRVVEFVQYMEPRTTIAILPYGLTSAQTVNKIGADKYEGPGLAVQWVEVEGPLYDNWPPTSHRRLFGNLKQAPAPIYRQRDRLEVVSKEPLADAQRILRAFTRRAFRRSVTDEDLKPFVALVKDRLEAKQSFEQAVRVGLMAVMVSPEFLFLREKPGKLDDFALANRLSYFLWSTMPDDELLTLAEQGKLSQRDTLHQQVERMLKHPKATAFTENFVGQWLGLRDIDFTEPSHLLYPEYDHMLKVSMIRETELFFAEVLRDDLSLSNFVASNFSMLNGRLARHYGIPLTPTPLPPGERGRGEGIGNWEFRKMPLPPESHRGGVLTMASVLKVTANGTTTSPVLRGAWVLDRILGMPPSPPPEGVSALEPDTRGATTIREQLAKHRAVATCASCHARIDPPGFALESFDVIGGWRDHYRTTGRGQTVMVDGRRMHYLKGPKVDPADVMPDGQRFVNIDEFKQLLLKDKDQLARALTVKLLVYATGAAPTTADKQEVEGIVRKISEKKYGFRTLVHEIVQSKLFQHK